MDADKIAEQVFEWWRENETTTSRPLVDIVADAIRQAAAAERERCAKAAEAVAVEYDAMEADIHDPARVCRSVAKAIREGKK